MVPKDYFDNVPEALRPHDKYDSVFMPFCNRNVTSQEQDDYEFQTERWLSTMGLNIYDGAVWSISSAIQGDLSAVLDYQNNVLWAHKTFQLADIKADAPCKGIMADQHCNTSCGFCYGDDDSDQGAAGTLSSINSFFFRMITDYYAIQGTTNALCPEAKALWTWNDWRPVLGENAWANILGPVQVSFINAGGDISKITDDDVGLKLATSIIPALKKLQVGDLGCVHYSPHNVWDRYDPDVGSTVSTENQVSLLAGLKALHHLIQSKPGSSHSALLPDLESLIAGLLKYLRSAYSPTLGFFRQGGRFNRTSGEFTWATGVAQFAVDCQTWSLSVLGPERVDGWFGPGTTEAIWLETLRLGGYCNATSHSACSGSNYQGVGFSDNREDNVLSGEWTLGAANMLLVWANQTTNETLSGSLLAQAATMRQQVAETLTHSVNFDDEGPWTHGASGDAVDYCSHRYFIPFGWWGNPVPSMASTGWASLVDNNFNPFFLGGGYQTDY